MYAVSPFLNTAFDGIIPAFGVLVAGAVLTMARSRREAREKAAEDLVDAAKRTAAELAEVQAHEVPAWGKKLVQRQDKMEQFIFGAPYGPRGFKEEFEQLKGDVGSIKSGVERILKNGNGHA